MILKSRSGVSFYQFSSMVGFESLFHGIFTRHAGISKPPYDSLNVAFSVGDDRRHVMRNRVLIKEVSNVERLVFLHQIHDRKTVIFKKRDRERIDTDFNPPLKADAVITDCRRIGLMIQVADCQSIMLYDPEKEVIANVHSGWRGSVQNIVGHTVGKMVDVFKCDPSTVYAGIGPSLGPCCAEFVNYKEEIPQTYWRYKNGNNHFDFWVISREQLLAAGLVAEHIAPGEICTKCNTDIFFSYRKEKKTGRFAAVIALL